MSSSAKEHIAVIGAGIVGVSTALQLQRDNYRVTLFDRRRPGEETSRWNAGVVARSSLVPFNNPSLPGAIPKVLFNKLPGVRINWLWAISHPGWIQKFIRNSVGKPFDNTVHALNELIELSGDIHRQWLAEAKREDLVRDLGWLFLYESAGAFNAHELQRQMYKRYDIDYQVLNSTELQKLEPALNKSFVTATWVKDTFSVSDSQQVVISYFNLFRQSDGEFSEEEIDSISPTSDGFYLGGLKKQHSKFDQVVVALGAWSETLLEPLAIKVPLSVERGYLMQYDFAGDAPLTRPIFDVEAGYVISPRQDGIQISTGVELTGLNYSPHTKQLACAEKHARELLDIGDRQLNEIAVGNRSTLPDSRPIIGPVKSVPGLWLALGHQHVGFSTGPATAKLLLAQMKNQTLPINSEAFLPSRFGI